MAAQGEPDVLVVGAGPVGLFTALWLAEGGVKVVIIDQAGRTTTSSHACAIHRRTLKLLDRIGLAREVLAHGRPIDSVGVYDRRKRLGEMRLPADSEGFPLAVVLPQSTLEQLLEQRLNHHYGVSVGWRHRLSRIEQHDLEVTATVEELAEVGTGHIIAHWELVVKQTHVQPGFIVGADGHGSQVRQQVGIGYQEVGGAEAFEIYYLALDHEIEPEQRVVLDTVVSSFCWPLPGCGCRWSFQMLPDPRSAEFPEKGRRLWRSQNETTDRVSKDRAQSLIRARVPWFDASVGEATWSATVTFERRLATVFGRGRCWLAGDAAHQTSPTGMQSMNVGMCEAADLAETMTKILRRNAPLERLERYNEQWREEWQRLLGIKGTLRPLESSRQWTKERCGQLLPCLPASGDNMGSLLNSIGLQWLP